MPPKGRKPPPNGKPPTSNDDNEEPANNKRKRDNPANDADDEGPPSPKKPKSPKKGQVGTDAPQPTRKSTRNPAPRKLFPGIVLEPLVPRGKRKRNVDGSFKDEESTGDDPPAPSPPLPAPRKRPNPKDPSYRPSPESPSSSPGKPGSKGHRRPIRKGTAISSTPKPPSKDPGERPEQPNNNTPPTPRVQEPPVHEASTFNPPGGLPTPPPSSPSNGGSSSGSRSNGSPRPPSKEPSPKRPRKGSSPPKSPDPDDHPDENPEDHPEDDPDIDPDDPLGLDDLSSEDSIYTLPIELSPSPVLLVAEGGAGDDPGGGEDGDGDDLLPTTITVSTYDIPVRDINDEELVLHDQRHPWPGSTFRGNAPDLAPEAAMIEGRRRLASAIGSVIGAQHLRERVEAAGPAGSRSSSRRTNSRDGQPVPGPNVRRRTIITIVQDSNRQPPIRIQTVAVAPVPIAPIPTVPVPTAPVPIAPAPVVPIAPVPVQPVPELPTRSWLRRFIPVPECTVSVSLFHFQLDPPIPLFEVGQENVSDRKLIVVYERAFRAVAESC